MYAFPVYIRPFIFFRKKQLVRHRKIDRGKYYLTTMCQGNHRTEQWYASRKIERAVDRIYDPYMLCIRPMMSALFGNDAVIGISFSNRRNNDLLGKQIRLRYDR